MVRSSEIVRSVSGPVGLVDDVQVGDLEQARP